MERELQIIYEALNQAVKSGGVFANMETVAAVFNSLEKIKAAILEKGK